MLNELYLADPETVTPSAGQRRGLARQLSGANLLYAGPDAAWSSAPGSHSAHVARQSALVSQAFTG